MSSGYYDRMDDASAYEACLLRNLTTTGDVLEMVERINDFDMRRAEATTEFMMRHSGKVADMVKKFTELDLILILEYMGTEVEDMEDQDCAVLRFLVSQSIRAQTKRLPTTHTLKTLRALPYNDALEVLSSIKERDTLVEWYTSACPPARRGLVDDEVPTDRIREKIKRYLSKYSQMQK